MGEVLTQSLQQASWKNLRRKPYILNVTKALSKKLGQCDRLIFNVEHKSGNIVLTYNTGAYELVKSLLSDFYHHNPNFFVEITDQVDKSDNFVGCVMQVCDSTSRGAKGRHLYTVNMYHTTSRMLVNGQFRHKFAKDELPLIELITQNYEDIINIDNDNLKVSLSGGDFETLSDTELSNNSLLPTTSDVEDDITSVKFNVKENDSEKIAVMGIAVSDNAVSDEAFEDCVQSISSKSELNSPCVVNVDSNTVNSIVERINGLESVVCDIVKRQQKEFMDIMIRKCDEKDEVILSLKAQITNNENIITNLNERLQNENIYKSSIIERLDRSDKLMYMIQECQAKLESKIDDMGYLMHNQIKNSISESPVSEETSVNNVTKRSIQSSVLTAKSPGCVVSLSAEMDVNAPCAKSKPVDYSVSNNAESVYIHNTEPKSVDSNVLNKSDIECENIPSAKLKSVDNKVVRKMLRPVENKSDHILKNSEIGSKEVNNTHDAISYADIVNTETTGWEKVKASPFREPDHLIVCNSNGYGLDPKILKPKFTYKKVLDDGKKNIQGAYDFIKNTNIKPKKSVIFQVIDNDLSSRSSTDAIINNLVNLLKLTENKFGPDVDIWVVEPLGRTSKNQKANYWYNHKANIIVNKLTSLKCLKGIVNCPKELKTANARYFHEEDNGYIHLNHSGYMKLMDAYKYAFGIPQSISFSHNFKRPHISHVSHQSKPPSLTHTVYSKNKVATEARSKGNQSGYDRWKVNNSGCGCDNRRDKDLVEAILDLAKSFR